MTKYYYELEMNDEGTLIVESDCEPNEFEYAVDFVRKLDDYSVEILLQVIRAIERKAEIFQPDNITKSFVF